MADLCGSFFYNDTATTEIYTLSLHDALPICGHRSRRIGQELAHPWLDPPRGRRGVGRPGADPRLATEQPRLEEHTSELQSRQYLVCRLLLDKTNNFPLSVAQLLPRRAAGHAS